MKLRGWPKAGCEQKNCKKKERGSQPELPPTAWLQKENDGRKEQRYLQDGDGEAKTTGNILAFHKTNLLVLKNVGRSQIKKATSQVALYLNGAEGRTRTGTGLPTTPSRWRVYQIPPLRRV